MAANDFLIGSVKTLGLGAEPLVGSEEKPLQVRKCDYK